MSEQRDRLRTISIADLHAEPVEWLWEPYIAVGQIAFLDGDPGVGKSLFALQLAAAVSRGMTLPDQRGDLTSETGQPRTTLLLAAEDALTHTVIPRLEAMEADVHQIMLVQCAEDGTGKTYPFMLQHMSLLAYELARVHPRLVIIDPIQAYLGPIDMNKANHTRPLMMGLRQLAEDFRCAVLCVRHPTKASGLASGGGKTSARGLGSIDMVGAARTGMFVEQYPERPELALLAQYKSNIGPLGRTQVFGKHGGRFQWFRASRLTAEVIAGGERGPEPTVLLSAALWLEWYLDQEGGPQPVRDVLRAANEAGHTSSTMQRAKRALRVVTVREHGSDGEWTWHLPSLTEA